MKVHVILEFPEIKDVDGDDASQIITSITEETLLLADNYGCTAWVDDVTTTEGESK